MKKLSALFLCFALLTLAGCGFHLRGVNTKQVHIDQIYIQSNSPRAPFMVKLRNRFYLNHIDIASNRAEAKYILYVNYHEQQPQLTSMTGGAEAGLYTVYAIANVALTTAKGKVLIPENTINLSRRFSSNTTQVLSANAQSRTLFNGLQVEMIEAIISQLATIQ